MNGRMEILNIWVDPVNRDQALRRIKGFLDKGNRVHSIFAVNPEKNFSVPKDPVLHKVFKSADLLIPDGIGIVIAVRHLYGVSLNRLPGVELMHELCALAAREKRKVFIFGANEPVNKTAVDKLEKQYPGLQVVGRSNGYVSSQQMIELVENINATKAEILFLALGSPKQEKWFATYAGQLKHVKVCQGIGGTLDTIAGNVKRAPLEWRKLNLEWLYRLLSDPKRASRQKALPRFAMDVLKARKQAIYRNLSLQ